MTPVDYEDDCEDDCEGDCEDGYEDDREDEDEDDCEGNYDICLQRRATDWVEPPCPPYNVSDSTQATSSYLSSLAFHPF